MSGSNTSEQFQELYDELGISQQIKGLQKIELLKKLESVIRTTFEKHPLFEKDRLVLGHDRVLQVHKAVLDQSWSGIQEYSHEFYKVMAASNHKQRVQRSFVRIALTTAQHGFDALDQNLVYFSALMTDAYDDWYRQWAQTVQGDELAKELEAEDKAGTLPKELYNHYTIITRGEGGNAKYSHKAYASYFPKEIGAIVGVFDRWLAALEKVEASTAKDGYVAFLQQYRACLAEERIERLEGLWTQLDELWMRIKHWVQIVHDIEYGYGDPLRCKVAPEFSCRLLDETYEDSNREIARIQGVMVDYFKQRPGPLAKGGLSALQQSMAGIYYLPFQAGVMLYFRFSGQSIPNRTEIREAHGVKIYFDPVSTGARQVDARQLARSVLADKARADDIDTIGTIVYHVASHEIGHAIYGLDAVSEHIKVSTKTLLEEPRAELTALHTLPLLLAAGILDQSKLQQSLASFMLQDLRRYSLFDSAATRPYTVSAMACWARAQDLGYITLDSAGKVQLDDSKALSFLKESSRVFETILDAEDRSDGPAIEKVMQDLQDAEKKPIVQHLIKQLFVDKVQLAAEAS